MSFYYNINMVAGMSECAVYDIIKLSVGMCLNRLYMVL